VFRIAAIILMVSLAGLGIYTFDNPGHENITNLEQITQDKTISTGDGEKKTLSFSNGSKIILNSNSSLTYRLGLVKNQTIDVFLEGEAWFDVKSRASHNQPVFAVTTPDGIIKDIGTKFLVTVQGEWSRVILEEGLVEIEPATEGSSNSQINGEKFRVKKGEMVQFDQSTILTREVVNTTFYTAWATGSMQFQKTDLREFAGYVEERFNVKVSITDPALADIKLDGAVYFRSVEGLVRYISEVTGISTYQSEDRSTIYIGNPNELHEQNRTE